jgi:hypothetical protein
MQTLRRALAVTTLIITMAATTGTLASTHVAAATMGACLVNGSMTTSPGIGVVPTANSMSLSGVASPCLGVGVIAGPFSAALNCGLDSLAGCAPGGGSITSSPFASCTGVIWFHAGAYFELHCKTPFGFMWIYFLATPNPLVQDPWTNINFTGYMDGVAT